MRKIAAFALIAVVAPMFAQSDIPSTGLGPPPRFYGGLTTSVYRAKSDPGNPFSQAGTAALTMLGHKAVGQRLVHLDLYIRFDLPGGVTPSALRIQRDASGAAVAEAPITSQASNGVVELKITGTAVTSPALEELLDQPQRFSASLATSSGTVMLGRLALARQTVVMGVMRPENEVPPVTGLNAGATGAVIANIARDDAGRISSAEVIFELVYQFAGPVTLTGLHVHAGAAGANGPIILDSGLTSLSIDTVTGGLKLRNEMDVTRPAIVAALEALELDPSNHYINLHTTANPGGAVRAQLRPVERHTYELGFGTRLGPRVADANRTVDVLRSESGEIVAAFQTITVAYSSYPRNVKFLTVIPGTTGEGAGNHYTTSVIAPQHLPAVDSLIRYGGGEPCLAIETEDNIPTECRANTVTAFGQLRIDAVVNAGGDPGNRIFAPGSVVEIYGRFPGEPASPGRLPNQPWPLTVNGLEVTIGDAQRKAPIAFINLNQINVQIPFETPAGSHAVRFWNRNRYPLAQGPFFSNEVLITILEDAPAILAVYNANGMRNTTATPASVGEILTVYATGLGQTDVPLRTGQPAPAEPRRINESTVTIGSQGLQAQSALAVPGWIGAYAIRGNVPTGLAPGMHSLAVTGRRAVSQPVNVWLR